MEQLKNIFSLHQTINDKTSKLLVYSQLGVVLLLWFLIPVKFLPTPQQTWKALGLMWSQGLAHHLMASFTLNLEAVAYSTVISLFLAYSTVIPFFRPIVAFVSKLRFLSMVGLTFAFSLLSKDSHALKLSLLVFSICVFFITSMDDVIKDIKKVQFDLARTLRMGDWRILWEVIILGQADKVFDILRQNAAIGWLMLTMVETLVISEGGIGVLLVTKNKYFRLDSILAIQLTVLAIGLGQDCLIATFKKLCCPYASISTERK